MKLRGILRASLGMLVSCAIADRGVAQTLDLSDIPSQDYSGIGQEIADPSYTQNLIEFSQDQIEFSHEQNEESLEQQIVGSQAELNVYGRSFGWMMHQTYGDVNYRRNVSNPHEARPSWTTALTDQNLAFHQSIDFREVPSRSDFMTPPVSENIASVEIDFLQENQDETITKTEVEVASNSQDEPLHDTLQAAPIELAQVPSETSLPSPVQPRVPKQIEVKPLPPVPEIIQSQPAFDSERGHEVSNNSDAAEETLIVKEFEVVGSTVFTQSELLAITTPYLNRPLQFQDLIELRSEITAYYVDQGYITSGAFIPAEQDLSQSKVTIQILEGRLDDIQIVGNKKLKAGYIRKRIARGAKTTLNINRLLKRLQAFQLDPLIDNLSAELTASDVPGFNVLVVTVKEADSQDIRVSLNNDRSKNIGSFQRKITAEDRNLLGLGDRATLSYGNTDGSNDIDLEYQIPVNAMDGSIKVGFGQSWTRVITEPFNDLDLKGASRTISLGYRQPLLMSPTQELAVGIEIERRESSTELLGMPFPLSQGADSNGKTKVTALSFIQEWVNRDQSQVLALRSNVGVGLGIGATQNENAPDGQFIHWRGQAQWIRQFAPDMSVLLRSDIQLSDRALPSMEQFGLGGQNSLRGYPNNFLQVDNGVTANAEARIPLFTTRNNRGILQVVPFIDYGYAWNWGDQTIEGSNHALSGGLGLRWQWSDRVTAQVYWGVPFISTGDQSSGFDNSQVYFSIDSKVF